MPVTSTQLIGFGVIAALACTAVSEPGESAGALEVGVTVMGMPASSDSHTIIVTVSGQREVQRRVLPHSGGSVLIADLPAGLHSVGLESPTACWRTSVDAGDVTIVRGQTSRIGFSVYCSGPPQIALVRTSPPHGSISERYVLEPAGTFRLQNLSYSGFHEYVGVYSRADSLYHFAFDANSGDWGATGTMSDGCLAVTYTDDMVLSDFEGGTYCSAMSGSWVTLAPIPQSRWQLGAASLHGIVYIAGGITGNDQSVLPAEILAYDPAQDSWRTVGMLPHPVWAPALAAVGDRIYVVGGCRDIWPLADLQVFDPTTGGVEVGPPMSHGRCGLAATVLDGRIHAIGGVRPNDVADEWFEPDPTHEVFDPSTGAWSMLAPLPEAREGRDAVAIGERIYVAGSGAAVQVYDRATDSWIRLGSPMDRYGVAAAAVAGKAYFFGGSFTNIVDRFDPPTQRWRTVASMPTTRTDHAAAVVDGAVYVVGGWAGGGLDVLERFTPW